MEEVKILEQTERCIKYFQGHCYTSNRITVYKAFWRTGIIRYMSPLVSLKIVKIQN